MQFLFFVLLLIGVLLAILLGGTAGRLYTSSRIEGELESQIDWDFETHEKERLTERDADRLIEEKDRELEEELEELEEMM